MGELSDKMVKKCDEKTRFYETYGTEASMENVVSFFDISTSVISMKLFLELFKEQTKVKKTLLNL